MKAHLFMIVTAISLAMCGCNTYYADQATKQGIQIYDNAEQARKHKDVEAANSYYRQAQQEFQKAVDYDQKGADRHYNLARVCQDLREYDVAIREYDLTIQLRPGDGRAHSGKIDCLVKKRAPQSQIDEAVATAVEIVDAGRIYLTLALAYYQAGRVGDMPVVLDKAGEASPRDAYVQATVGRFFSAIGDTPSAINYLRTAYELNPNEPGVAYDLGVLGQKLPPVAIPSGK